MDQEDQFSDFESEEFDEIVNKMLSEKREKRIKQLRTEALNQIKVSFSISQFVTYTINKVYSSFSYIGAGKAVLECKKEQIEKTKMSEGQLRALNEFLCFKFLPRYVVRDSKDTKQKKRKYTAVVQT